MKIVKLKGGLGNQMFQYAFAELLKKETGEEVKIDLSAFSDLGDDQVRIPRIQKFDILIPVASPEDIQRVCKFRHNGNSQSNKYRLGIVAETLLNKKYVFERNHSLCTKEQMKSAEYFDGYWQDWRFVDSVIDELKAELVPKTNISLQSKQRLDEIEACNSVFVGVRRGDYLTVRPEHYGVFDQAYYERTMQLISEKVDDPVFYIFSNDIKWVQDNLNFSKHKIVFITDTVDDFEDLILMSRCKHSIIPNSTYHWWGARLNEYPGKVVVAPTKWFADDAHITILPDRWEKG